MLESSVCGRQLAEAAPSRGKQVPPLRIALDEANRNAPVGMTGRYYGNSAGYSRSPP